MLASFTLVRLGGNPQASADPAKLALLEQKEQLEQRIDLLKYQQCGDVARGLSRAVESGARGSSPKRSRSWTSDSRAARRLLSCLLDGSSWSQAAMPPPGSAPVPRAAPARPGAGGTEVLRVRLARANSPYLRAEGDWGVADYDTANSEFRAAAARRMAMPCIACAGVDCCTSVSTMSMPRAVQRSVAARPEGRAGHLGLARVSADGFDDQALSWADKALAVDPKLAAAHELLANLALEDNHAGAGRQRGRRGAGFGRRRRWMPWRCMRPSRLLADRSPDQWRERIHSINAVYGPGFAIAAAHLMINRRYEDGVAITARQWRSRELWSARSQLGINLMRLGQDEEAREQLSSAIRTAIATVPRSTACACWIAEEFRDFHGRDHHPEIESQGSRPAVSVLPRRCSRRPSRTTRANTSMTLRGPVQVEVYPDHEDFAVRTLGMPGLGALGVTFGPVVAMDSPSGRKPGSSTGPAPCGMR